MHFDVTYKILYLRIFLQNHFDLLIHLFMSICTYNIAVMEQLVQTAQVVISIVEMVKIVQ